MQCKTCEKEIPSAAVYCVYCGAPVSGEVASQAQLISALASKRFINMIGGG